MDVVEGHGVVLPMPSLGRPLTCLPTSRPHILVPRLLPVQS